MKGSAGIKEGSGGFGAPGRGEFQGGTWVYRTGAAGQAGRGPRRVQC